MALITTVVKKTDLDLGIDWNKSQLLIYTKENVSEEYIYLYNPNLQEDLNDGLGDGEIIVTFLDSNLPEEYNNKYIGSVHRVRKDDYKLYEGCLTIQFNNFKDLQ